MEKRNLLVRILLGAVFLIGIVATGAVYADASECVDSDGDGWGWDGSASCPVGGSTEVVTAGPCVDPDGDGWGWDGVSSCPMEVDPVETSDEVDSVAEVVATSDVVDPVETSDEVDSVAEVVETPDVVDPVETSDEVDSVAEVVETSDEVEISVGQGSGTARDQWLNALNENSREFRIPGNPDNVMDPALQLDIATNAAAAFDARPGLTRTLIERSDGRVHAVFNEGPGPIVQCNTSIEGDAGLVQIGGSSAFSQILGLAKLTTCHDGPNVGIPHEMNNQQRAILVAERDAIRTLVEIDQYGVTGALPSFVSSKDNAHFWAVATAAFMSTTADRAELAKTFPELHNIVRDYYHRYDIPAASPTVLSTNQVDAQAQWVAALESSSPNLDPALLQNIASNAAAAFGQKAGLNDYVIRRSDARIRLGNGRVECNNDTFIGNDEGRVEIPNTGHYSQIYALAQITDCDGGRGRVDGIPHEMTDQQRAILVSEREKMRTRGTSFGAKVSFSGNVEFWASVSATFMAKPAEREILATAFPELHDVVRDYYQRNDLPAAADY